MTLTKEMIVPKITTTDNVVGFPTSYDVMTVQIKSFFNSTRQLWKKQKLVGNDINLELAL